MRLRFLGVWSQGGGCPTLFATDRGTYVVQGWKVEGHPTALEIPSQLMGFVEEGTELGVPLKDTGNDTVILYGVPVTDAEALSQMDIPSHENCVEVPLIVEGSTHGSTEG